MVCNGEPQPERPSPLLHMARVDRSARFQATTKNATQDQARPTETRPDAQSEWNLLGVRQ